MFLDKVYGLCNLILLSASLFASLGEAHFAERPNVIILYTDDHGSLDLGSFGATDLETPNMDAIVQSGIRLTQFYAAPVCTPSRVSLMTGQAPHRMGLAGNITAVSGQTDGLRAESFTLVDLFKSGGYRTAHIGKWHLGFSSETQPLAHGFDHSFGHLVGCIDNYSHFYYWRGPNRHDLYRNGEEVFYQGQYFPELMLTEAMEFIDSVNDQPFFVYFAMNAPHYPYQGKEKWLRHYKEKDMSEARRLYAAFLSTQDEIIGELLTYLEKKGLRENTIIILQGDNGHSVEERAHFGGGYTGPYRGAKASLFEGGIRVPAAISWPHALPAGQTRDQFAVNTDWLPTLAELCDLNLPSEKRDGTSLVSILKEPTAPDTHPKGYAWTFRNQWAVRMDDWKLMMNPLTNQTNPEGKRQSYPGKMLVNLAEDPSEQNNLIDRFPGRAAAMENLYNLWKKQPLSGID